MRPQSTPLLASSLCAAAALAAAGCVGSLGESNSGDETGTEDSRGAAGSPLGRPTPGSPGAGTAAGAAGLAVPGAPPESAGPLPLRRLTRREYNNTVAALLGVTSAPADAFPADARNEAGFLTPLPVSTLDARSFLDAAETLAAYAVRNLPTILPCDPKSAGEDACARRFVESFGRRAYRRGLEPAEVSDLYAIYDGAKNRLGLDFATGVGLVVQAVLQSPKFLYRWEVAPSARPVREASLVRLTPHQVASRLSFFLAGATPDDRLLDEADAGRLATPAQVVTQARRLLSDARAADAASDFHRQWLRLDGADGLDQLQKSTKEYPQWNDGVRAAARAGFDAFVAGALLGPQADAKLTTLLVAPVAYVRDSTSALYGLGAVTGAALVRRDLDPAQRAGLLTQIGFLATHATASGSHPTKRGVVLWRDVVCGPLGQLPDDVPAPAPPAPNVSTRERFAMHDQGACAVCHRLIDPLGFAFENYDGIGRWRATDAGKPVDATGQVSLPSGAALRFANAIELSRALADSEDVKRCVATQWLRYALGRGETDADAGSRALAQAAFARAGGDIRELLLALVGSRTFLFRTPDEGEVLP